MVRYTPAITCWAAIILSAGCRPPQPPPMPRTDLVADRGPIAAVTYVGASREADTAYLKLTMRFVDTADTHPTCEVQLQNIGQSTVQRLLERSDGAHLGITLNLADDAGGNAKLTSLGETQFMATTGTFRQGFDFKAGDRLVWRVVLSDSFKLQPDHGYTIISDYGVNSAQWGGDIGVSGLHFRTKSRVVGTIRNGRGDKGSPP